MGSEKSVVVYAEGPVAISVCAPKEMPEEEVIHHTNMQRPTGISSQWSVDERNFRGGEPNPCPCDEQPETRRHWMLRC